MDGEWSSLLILSEFNPQVNCAVKGDFVARWARFPPGLPLIPSSSSALHSGPNYTPDSATQSYISHALFQYIVKSCPPFSSPEPRRYAPLGSAFCSAYDSPVSPTHLEAGLDAPCVEYARDTKASLSFPATPHSDMRCRQTRQPRCLPGPATR